VDVEQEDDPLDAEALEDIREATLLARELEDGPVGEQNVSCDAS